MSAAENNSQAFSPELHTDPAAFYQFEAANLLKNVNANGPVESFSPERGADILDAAIQTGVIAPGAFDNCAAFGNGSDALEEKKLRYEAKRAVEIQKILEAANGDDEPSNEQKSQDLYAEGTMASAVLVEAARKYKRELDDGTLTSRNAELYDRAIDTAQEVLFPTPNPEVAAYAITGVINKITAIDPAQAALIKERYPFMEQSESSIELLSDERTAKWREYLHETYDAAFETVHDRMGETELSNATLPEASAYFMKAVGLPMASESQPDGWSAIARDDVDGFRVDPANRVLICGKRKQEITWENFEKLILHEVGIHATRAQNGFESGTSGLQTGLPGNQEVEEGLGLLIEGLWSNQPFDAIGRDHFRYLTVCYADGKLDGEPHTETETLEFASTLVGAQKAGRLNDETGMQTARKLAFDHVKRAYRGMPPGKIMYSNLSYLSGKLKVIEMLATTEATPAAMLTYLQQGKFNPFDEAHTSFVNDLEVAA